MNNRRPYHWKDYARICAGIVMLILGVIGLVLPVLQGILFLLVAAILLAPYSRMVRRCLDWSKQKYPGLHKQAQSIGRKFSSEKPES